MTDETAHIATSAINGEHEMSTAKSPLCWRKKPVVVEAFQMTEERRMDNSEWPKWLHKAWNKERNEPGALQRVDMSASLPDALEIVTLEGNHLISWGDWVIRGVKGELYPCKPDIFAATYESADSETNSQVGGRAAAAPLDDPYAALSQHLHGDGGSPAAREAQDEKVRRLIAAAGKLNGIVEGIDGAMTYGTWRGENTGYRLKDTEEWVNFYIALAATHNFGDDA